MEQSMNKRISVTAAIVIFMIYVLLNTGSFITDYWWFDHYQNLKTFFTLFITGLTVKLIFATIFLIIISINTFMVIRLSGGKHNAYSSVISYLPPPLQNTKYITIVIFAVLVFLAYIMGSGAKPFWSEILIYFNSSHSSSLPVDPVFNRPVEFYFFSLPFYNFIHGWFIGTLILISIVTALSYILFGGISFKFGRPAVSKPARAHLSVLGSLFMLIISAGYYLSAFDILFTQRGKFFGAGYTAVHSQLFAYRACMILAIIASVLIIVSIFRKTIKFALLTAGSTFALFVILGSIVPSFQQRFTVEPNELERERPFILNNIKFTRLAYGLSDITIREFENNGQLSREDIENNQDVLSNIRLWDWRPLKQTYNQLQGLKPYYSFMDVDVDRYEVNGKLSAVNIAGRELLNSELAPNSQTWVNNHLVYTHGYGVVMNRVDRVTTEGQPDLIIKNIPPQSDFIDIKRPQIYYGEHNNDYIITNSEVNPGEFDYPSGDTNSYNTYEGTGGVILDSFFKKLIFAVSFSDINILISNNISNKSRIHYFRNITKMAKRIAPFLEIDTDPYIIISDNGELYYIIDAYTISDGFPYSTPLNGSKTNYVRNSVKIVINAYDGNINFYINDDTDPIIKTYSSIFPEIFSPLSKMPQDIKKHLRYPETMFDIQAQMLLRYHMTDANVFYNNEDMWELPKQIYDSSEQLMESYYLITKLPGETETEFVLMLPFTPFQKNNMLGFLIARCDNDKYGQMTLYRLPKEKLSYGPMQLEARINQDSDISKQLSLWSQKGSRVIRGNMLAIPINESLLFVEPLYLKAESSEMPELKQVIVCFRDSIVMEETLTKALEKTFGSTMSASEDSTSSELDTYTDKDKDKVKSVISETVKTLSRQAYEIYTRAENRLRSGDFEGYGAAVSELGEVLKKLDDQAKSE